jgi:N-acetylglucosamine-6-phosphate deacetylase
MQKNTLEGNIWTLDGFRAGSLSVVDGRIAEISFTYDKEAAGQPYITPGLVDLQLNGAFGLDFTDDPASVYQVASGLPRWGVTAFLPTYITAPPETYQTALAHLQSAPSDFRGARPLGAHFEGPFLSEKYKGAHRAEFLRAPNLPEVESWTATGLLKMVTLAPEPQAAEVSQKLSAAGVLVSAGHSAATYAEANAGFEAGVRIGTHLFNAMSPLHHRQPGLTGALLEHDNVAVGIIPDGIHLDPAVVRLVYKLKGWQNIAVVTDAMAALGMSPGRYELAGLSVVVDGNSARLADKPETLAGSILSLDAAIRNMVAFTGCPLHLAVAMATVVPARLLGLTDGTGALRPDGVADIAVFSPEFTPTQTIICGKIFSS